MKKILITGASSSLGKEMLDNLNNKAKIIAHYNLNKPKVNNNIQYISSYELSKNNFFIIKQFKPDCIIHLAAVGLKNSSQNKDKIYKINYEFTKELVKLSKFCKCKLFIFTSTSKIYEKSFRPLNEKSIIKKNIKKLHYENSKFLSEKYIKKYSENNKNCKYIVLRPFLFISRRDSRINIFGKILIKLNNLKKIKIENPNCFIDVNTASDLSKCIIKIIDKMSFKYIDNFFLLNVGSGKKPLKLINLINKIFAKNTLITYDKEGYSYMNYPDNLALNKLLKNKWESSSNLIKEIKSYCYNFINEKKR